MRDFRSTVSDIFFKVDIFAYIPYSFMWALIIFKAAKNVYLFRKAFISFARDESKEEIRGELEAAIHY